jgi:hypothetical protein
MIIPSIICTIHHLLLDHHSSRVQHKCKGRFTLWPKVERSSISTNHIARNQEFGLSTLHTMAKVQRPLQFKMITFGRRRRTLKGSLGRTGMETQTMVKRPSVFFIKKSITDKIFAVRLEGLFWARNKVGCPFGFGLWAWPLEASNYGCPSREAVGVHGQRFGLWAWPLEASHYAGRRLQLLYFIGYYQPISLDSQQSLATQSHSLSTSTAIVWSSLKKIGTSHSPDSDHLERDSWTQRHECGGTATTCSLLERVVSKWL